MVWTKRSIPKGPEIRSWTFYSINILYTLLFKLVCNLWLVLLSLGRELKYAEKTLSFWITQMSSCHMVLPVWCLDMNWFRRYLVVRCTTSPDTLCVNMAKIGSLVFEISVEIYLTLSFWITLYLTVPIFHNFIIYYKLKINSKCQNA